MREDEMKELEYPIPGEELTLELFHRIDMEKDETDEKNKQKWFGLFQLIFTTFPYRLELRV